MGKTACTFEHRHVNEVEFLECDPRHKVPRFIQKPCRLDSRNTLL